MRKIAILVALLISVLFLYQMSHAELLVADDFKGKLKDKYWKGQKESWKIKNEHLEIHRVAGDGNGAQDFGYGVVEFENFGLRLDFYLFAMMIFRVKWRFCFAPTKIYTSINSLSRPRMDSVARTLHAGTSGKERIAAPGMSIVTSEPNFPFLS